MWETLFNSQGFIFLTTEQWDILFLKENVSIILLVRVTFLKEMFQKMKKGSTDIKCAELNFLFLFLSFSKKFFKKYINNLTRKPIFKTQTLKSSYCMPQKIGNA